MSSREEAELSVSKLLRELNAAEKEYHFLIPGWSPANASTGIHWMRSQLYEGYFVEYRTDHLAKLVTFKCWEHGEPEPAWGAGGPVSIEDHIREEARAFCESSRWESPDQPGSACVQELWQRVSAPSALKAFRATEEGQYLLTVIEAFESAFNDDWLPYKILDLSLPKAKVFISSVARELANTTSALAIQKLRQIYSDLLKASPKQ